MNRTSEHGGVSLFIVIFTTIVITIIVVGFTKFIIHNQQQTMQNDLSDRAYDSAMAGVEDAKRLLIAYTKECASGSTAACQTYKDAIARQECDTISRASVVSTVNVDGNEEYRVGTVGDNQGYTCVKIATQTENVEGSISMNGSKVVHLKSASDFDTIKLTWFTSKDAGSAGGTSPTFSGAYPNLNPQASWRTSSPPILRTQYIPGGITLTDLDKDAHTAFLYPVRNGADTKYILKDDIRRAGTTRLTPQAAACTSTFATSGGICSKSLTIDATRDAYLQLTSMYNATSFVVELYNGTTRVNFDGVSPAVDSTGRAGEVLRRVRARVEIDSVPLPGAPTLSVEGNLCKAFTLGDDDHPYSSTCEP